MQMSVNAKRMLIWVVVSVITGACFLMNGPMRGGLPIDNTLAERLEFIAGNHLVWTLSWCVWMTAALGLFVFCSVLASEIKPTLARTIGLAMVAMGIGPDLIAEVIYAFIIPKAYLAEVSVSVLAMLEIAAMHLTGFLGNGLYNIGGLILTLTAIREGVVRGWVAVWGITAWLLGIGLSVSVAIGNIAGAEALTALSMVLSTAWMLVFAYRVVGRSA